MSDIKVKNAVILAAGKGARLDRPDSPKPLVKVGNKSLILWNIEQLQEFGVETIYMVLGFRGEEIKKELTNHPSVTAKIEYIQQEDSSKSGMLSSFLSVLDCVQTPFFLAMSDLVLEKNPYSLFGDCDEFGDSIASLVSVDKKYFNNSGARSQVYIEDSHIKEIGRDLKDYSGFECGIYCFTKKALMLTKSLLEENLDIENFDVLFKKIAEKNKFQTILLKNSEWFDVNTPATHARAEIFARNRFKAPVVFPGISNMKEVEFFSNFQRQKLMKTNIILKKNLLDKLHKIRLIPEEFSNSPHFILTDSIVDKLHGERILNGFLKAGYNVRKLVIPFGESSKSTTDYVRLADEIFSYGMDKHSIIISLGGGVVNNMAGFLASTLYRGVGLMHIPTTTMAQFDAAIDFKQAVNSPKGKNLLGSYYPAHVIAIDPSILSTLEKRHILNGLSESIKHALTQDKVFFNYLLENYANSADIDFLEEVAKRTLDLKIPLLSGNVDEDYNEMLPQYGHCVGHAVEHLSSYDLLHGEALSIGMCVTAEIAKLLGICGQETVDLHYTILEKYNLPTKTPDYMTEQDVCDAICFDKHHVDGAPHMSLVEKIGRVWNDNGVHSVPVDYTVVKRAIKINQDRNGNKK